MTLRRGFKSNAEAMGHEIRAELRLRQTDQLDPWKLADHLGIPVLTLAEFEGRVGPCPSIAYFRKSAPERFSAVTVTHGHFRVILHNESHARPRQVSNLAHELSHTVLEHPANPDLSPRGCAKVDPTLEAEANWLMGTLLVPREGALCLIRDGANISQVAQHFGVSEKLCQWRINATGVLRQLGSQ